MLAIWSLFPLPFLNPAGTSGSSWFTCYWRLAWRILSITLLACKMSAVYGSLNILWHCLSLELEWKLTFFQFCGHCWVFQICWHIEWSPFTAINFLNLSPPLCTHHCCLSLHPLTCSVVTLPPWSQSFPPTVLYLAISGVFLSYSHKYSHVYLLIKVI